MRIGYFGGSFDPPHLGHLAVARAARDRFALDHVLLAPTARQPLKPGGPVASFADRLAMTELLCLDEPGLGASAIDGPQPNGAPNYTVDTLRRLHSELAATTPDLQLFAILGADAFLTFPHWREPEELLRLAEWIIVSRPGHLLPTLTVPGPNPSDRLQLLKDISVPISATTLRSWLRAGGDSQSLLPHSVYRYIRNHHLYAEREGKELTPPGLAI